MRTEGGGPADAAHAGHSPRRLWALVHLWVCWAPLAAADIYIAYDENGGTVFTDLPPHAGAIPIVASPDIPATNGANLLPNRVTGGQHLSVGMGADTDLQPRPASEAEATLLLSGEVRLAHDNKSFRSAD